MWLVNNIFFHDFAKHWKKSLTSFQAGRTIDIHNDSLLYFIEILKFRKRENISFKNIFKYYKSKIIENPRKIFLNQLATWPLPFVLIFVMVLSTVSTNQIHQIAPFRIANQYENQTIYDGFIHYF